jgi:hypothetical protein
MLYSYKIGPWHPVLMQASYIGTLKTLLWAPVFGLFGTNVRSLREPGILFGALTLWLFFVLLRLVAGERAAAIGCILLAADPMFLLTSVYDWGPQVLQHPPLIAGLLLVVMALQNQAREHRLLAGAFFLFGLALWDKALALWVLGAMGLSGLVFYPRLLLRLATPRKIGWALCWLAVGSFPLILYNLHARLGTLRENAHAGADASLSFKATVLKATFDGSGLFGFLNGNSWDTPAPHQPITTLERASAALASVTRHPTRYGMEWAFLLALLLTPLGGRGNRRAILFCFCAMAVTWLQMVWTRNCGTSVHHTILLWPFPQVVMAMSFAAASRRGRWIVCGLGTAMAVLAVAGTLVSNEYFLSMTRFGGAKHWSTAIAKLADYMKTQPASAIYASDWGYSWNLALLSRGKLPQTAGRLDQRYRIPQLLSKPGSLFIAHSEGMEFFPESNRLFLEVAQELGFQPVRLTVICDDFGRPVFEVYRIQTGPPQDRPERIKR